MGHGILLFPLAYHHDMHLGTPIPSLTCKECHVPNYVAIIATAITSHRSFENFQLRWEASHDLCCTVLRDHLSQGLLQVMDYGHLAMAKEVSIHLCGVVVTIVSVYIGGSAARAERRGR